MAEVGRKKVEPAITPPRAGRIPVLVGTLGGATAVAPLATDMYVAAFPSMAEEFGAPASAVQLTMTAFVVGLAIGQFVVGPISDAAGRRQLLLWGTAAFSAASFLSAIAPTVEVLVALRFVQGVAGAVGIVLGRAVITDLFEGPELAKNFATLTSISILGPVLAPVAGGLVLAVGAWPAIFVILGVVGALLYIAVAAYVPESLPPNRRAHHAGKSIGAMFGLLRRSWFIADVLVLSFGMLALFAYILESSFVFQDRYGLSPTQYSLVFTLNAVGILGASATVGRVAQRVSLPAILAFGVGLSLAASGVLGALAWTGHDSLFGTWTLLFAAIVGLGFALPSATALALAEGRDTAGGASALLGGTQFIFAGLAAPALAAIPAARTGAMAAVLLIAFGLMLVVTLLRLLRGASTSSAGSDGNTAPGLGRGES